MTLKFSEVEKVDVAGPNGWSPTLRMTIVLQKVRHV